MIFIDDECGESVPEAILNKTAVPTIWTSAAIKDQDATKSITSRKEYMIYRLNNKFPTILSVTFMSSMVCFGLAAIALQVAMIVFKTPHWEICHGIWGGITCILVAISNLIIGKNFILNYFFSLKINLIIIIFFIF